MTVLSRTEVAVLDLFMRGHTSRSAARVLICSKSTIETHMQNLRQKLSAVNMTDAVVKGLQHKILELPE